MSHTISLAVAATMLDGLSLAEIRGGLNAKIAKLDQQHAEAERQVVLSGGVGFSIAETTDERNDVSAAASLSNDSAKKLAKKIGELESAVRGWTVVERAKDLDRKFCVEKRDVILGIIRKNPKAEDRSKRIKELRAAWDATHAAPAVQPTPASTK